MSISTRGNKIVQARRVGATFSLSKICNVHEKTSHKVKTDEILKACALFVIYNPVTTLHSRYNFVLQLYENAHVFSESEARNFFVYIIIVCLCTVGVILTLFAQTSVCKSSILFFIHFSIKS